MSGKSPSQSMKKYQMNTLDPGAFSESLLRVLNESGGDFAVLSKSLERSDLELSKYGDRFFEVVFLGSSAQSRSMVPVEGGGRNLYAIFSGDSTEASIQAWVTLLKKLLNLRPALRDHLQDVLKRLIASLAVRGQPERVKLAMFLAKALTMKVPGIVGKPLLQALFTDCLLRNGFAIHFIVNFSKFYLKEKEDGLLDILTLFGGVTSMVSFLPTGKQSLNDLIAYMREEGVDQIVQYLERQQKEADLKELEAGFSVLLRDLDQKVPHNVAVEVREHIGKCRVPVIEAAGLLWEAIVESIKWPGSGTDQKKNEMVAISHLSRWGGAILKKLCTDNTACQMQLIKSVQNNCWREEKMLTLFPRVIRLLYEVDLLCEDVILQWFYKASNDDGREVFLEELKPFICWLEEAEEEA